MKKVEKLGFRQIIPWVGLGELDRKPKCEKKKIEKEKVSDLNLIKFEKDTHGWYV